MSGWKLASSLFAKQFSALGDSIAQALASFDPVTATEVDRDNLKAKLHEVAVKLAAARTGYTDKKKVADDLAAQIAQDEKAAAILITKFDAGQIDEATLNEFANNLEAMKARQPGVQQDVQDAKDLVDTLQDIINTVEKKLTDFEANAQKALRAIDQARADQERQKLRLESQQEMRDLQSGLGSPSTALGALNKQAQKLRVQADAARIEADIGQKPIDRMNAVEEARRIAAGTATPAAESAADRLRRLTGAAPTTA